MRILSFLLIISLSHFTKGQNVFTKFKDTLVMDDFSSNKNNFPQKYNSLELTIIEDGQYSIKRLNDEGKSITYLKVDKPLSSYEVSVDLLISKDNKEATAGLILHGQTVTEGGIFIEVSGKKKYRVFKINGNQQRLLGGLPKNRGWQKSKNLSKKSNTIMVRVEDGYFDIYLNGKYTFTSYDTQFDQGKVGLFASASTEVLADNFYISKSGNTLPKSNIGVGDNNNAVSGDPAFEEVILIFKTKIDLQQKEIETLEREVNRCKSMLNYDTTLVTRSTELEIDNRILSSKLDSTSKQLTVATKRLVYLESLKEDIEAGSNGDLVLNLSSILAEIKRENKTLKITNQELERTNTQQKKDNEVLLREIERMKYLLEMQE